MTNVVAGAARDPLDAGLDRDRALGLGGRKSGVTHVTAAAPRFPRDDGTSRAGTIVLPETDGLVDDLGALRVNWRERRLGPPTAPASPGEADEQEADRRQDRAHEDDPADEEGIGR